MEIDSSAVRTSTESAMTQGTKPSHLSGGGNWLPFSYGKFSFSSSSIAFCYLLPFLLLDSWKFLTYLSASDQRIKIMDLVGREVTVELKNDIAIRGTLHSVDQYLNIKLENTRAVD
ncbi:hypothetical protein J1N35_021084 [Gossypium stocksii]|uniref:Sm domain-containing protein n=1 Tax=Gossypium stocksii TaxID=47602 RepID=A0A9D4A0Z7_9ROSI|nr:hypothetical protein J1N35_021084 [Gossypium stocksii]